MIWRRSLLLLVLVLSTAAGLRADEEDAERASRLRVMTFNIRFNNPNDGPNAWPERRDDVAALIRDSDLDVVGLQEALHDQIKDLEHRLPDFEWYGVGRDDGADGGEFVPIFYRRDRFAVLEATSFWLSETPDVPGTKSWDSSLPRVTTRMRLKDRATGRIVIVYNTHFDHRGRDARAESAKLLLARIAAEAAGEPVILTGDFNTRMDSEPYRLLAEKSGETIPLRDSRLVSATPAEGPNSTWNGFEEIALNARIDFIFVGSGLDVRSHRTIDQRRAGDRFLSDHLPVLAEVVYAE